VVVAGTFNPDKQILLRNRYNDGKYGYEVLTLFTSTDKKSFWVDRGWVQAGATATTPPVVTALPSGEVSISGRLRLDSSLPRGSFFALPGKGEGLVSELNAQSQLDTEKFYIDLLSGSEKSLTPEVTAQLPELSDGPHMAYALQWIFFGGLVLYGRILIRRTR
jgi:surfeit locus 1 family protein